MLDSTARPPVLEGWLLAVGARVVVEEPVGLAVRAA